MKSQLAVEEVYNFQTKAAKKSASGVPVLKFFLDLQSVMKAETFCPRKHHDHVQKYMPAAAQPLKKRAGSLL